MDKTVIAVQIIQQKSRKKYRTAPTTKTKYFSTMDLFTTGSNLGDVKGRDLLTTTSRENDKLHSKKSHLEAGIF